MINLIKKELILQKKMLWFGFLYGIFLFFVFVNPGFKDFVYIMAAFGISYMTIAGVAQAEYKNNSDTLINSLPLTRQEIVLSKYLSVIVFIFIALAIVGVVGVVFHMLPLPFNYRFISLKDITITLVSVSFLAAVSLPAYFISGAQWVRIINMVIFLLIFFAPAQITTFLVENNQQAWIQSLLQMMQNQTLLLSTALIIIIIIITAISYSISLRIYLNKDF